jgi:hypothetical protein
MLGCVYDTKGETIFDVPPTRCVYYTAMICSQSCRSSPAGVMLVLLNLCGVGHMHARTHAGGRPGNRAESAGGVTQPMTHASAWLAHVRSGDFDLHTAQTFILHSALDCISSVGRSPSYCSTSFTSSRTNVFVSADPNTFQAEAACPRRFSGKL